MIGLAMQPAVLQSGMMTHEKACDLFNAAFRLSGAGVDIIWRPPPGKENQPLLAPPMPPGPPQGIGPEVGQMALPTR